MIVVNNSSPQSKRFKVKPLTRSLHFNYTGAPCTQEQKPMPKKIWLPIHLNNFGNHVTVRPSICTTGKSMRNVKLSSYCGSLKPVFNLIIDIHIMVN